MSASRCRSLLASVLASALLLTTGCGSTASKDAKNSVVASIFPIYDAASSVGGKHQHVVNLLPLDPLASLTSKQAETLKEARLAIILGGGAQPSVEEIAAQRSGPTIRIFDYFHDDVGGLADARIPPVWLDVSNMAKIVEIVRDHLVELDPGNRPAYEKSAKKRLKSLDLVDRRFAESFATCERNAVITMGVDVRYLADAYGLKQVVVRDEADLASKIRELKPTTVFFGRLPTLDVAEHYRDQFGVRIAALDTLVVHTDQARRGGASYFSVMDLDYSALINGLDCKRANVK
jgi:zinc transport system substrate-binding protein